MKGLWAIGFAVTCGAAQAQCSDGIEKALRAFDAKTPTEGRVATAHCKPWPPAPDSVLAAVMAFRPTQHSAQAPDWQVPAVVALVDARTGKVLHGRRFIVSEDAATQVGDESLRVDTANYALAPGVRALGLRFHNEGRRPAAADGWWNDELMLLVPEGRALRPVFCQPLMAQEAVEGSLSHQRPGAIWKQARLTVSVGPQPTTGWRDLVITATEVLDGAPDATFDATPHRSRSTYRYEGGHYKLLTRPALFWSGYRCSVE